jgi:hypothetical protein
MAAPPDGVRAAGVTAGIPAIEDEHASVFQLFGRRLMEVIGKRMEPNRVSIRLFGDVARGPYDDAEVTEVQVQV